jgi:hypothetical protein
MDLKLIQNVLHGRHEIAQWQITERRSRRHERYLTFLQPEAEREASAVRWQVWLALPSADGGRQGEASFTVTPAHGGVDLRALIAQALGAAQAAPNPAWTLPAPGDPGVASGRRGGVVACATDGGAAAGAQMAIATDFLADQAVTRDPGSALDGSAAAFADAVHAAPWTRPSALELFATIEDRRLVNHRGLDLAERRTRCYAEFVLLHRPSAEAEECEFYDRVEALSLADLRLAQRVADAAACLRDGAAAAPPPSGTMPVVISGAYLSELLGWYAAHADAGLHVRRVAALALDAPVLARRAGDRLHLASDAAVPSLAAYRFDEHGWAASRQELVRDDALVGLHGSGRWMQVLGRPPRGQLATLTAPPGSADPAALRAGALEVVRFSEFHPRHDTGAFSGEIRFGWWHAPDGTRRPVRGGSVSGVLRDALADAVFSRDTATVDGYHGPQAARMTATVAVADAAG